MAILKLAERVKETTQTIGTGTLSLDGAPVGFQSFLTGIGNGNKCTFLTTDGTDWEVTEGTLTSGSPNTLSRTTIIASSNAGAAVSWATGNKNVALVHPGARVSEVQIAKTVASGASSVSFTGLDSTYDWYRFRCTDGNTQNDNVALWARFTEGGVEKSGASDYQYADVALARGSTVTQVEALAAQIVLNNSIGNATGEGFSFDLTLGSAADTTICQHLFGQVSGVDSSNVLRNFIVSGNRTQSPVVAQDGVIFRAASGNISGTFICYGGRIS